MKKAEVLHSIAQRLRASSIQMTTNAGSGHPSTCMSAADIVACLFFSHMRYNPKNQKEWGNDEFVLSKGHAAPLLWSVYAEAGIIKPSELEGFRTITSPLEGHPTFRFPWVRAATGSLGQGLSVGVGIAGAMRLGGSSGRVFVMLGDGECAEGMVWEAAASAADYKLSNLRAIVDVNRFGQSAPTRYQHNTESYAEKFRSFGWHAIEIDGHDIMQILKGLEMADAIKNAPVAIIAKTYKGKGVSFVENKDGWHGKPIPKEMLAAALKELGPLENIDAAKLIALPPKSPSPKFVKKTPQATHFEKETATREGYGRGLLNLGVADTCVVAIDGDVKNSTMAEAFFKQFPNRGFECYIAEQQMAGMALGLSSKGYHPFVSTFSAFLSRAHDVIRMAQYSASNVVFCGSHSGVSIGQDGPSQMGLEDVSMFSSVPGAVVLCPSDAHSAQQMVFLANEQKGLVYIRTARPKVPLLYGFDEKVSIGGSKVLKKSSNDQLTVVASGVCVHEAIKASAELNKENIFIRVIDAYSIVPLDAKSIKKNVDETKGKLIVVEDHYPVGGLGTQIAHHIGASFTHLCVKDQPRSGSPEELMDKYGISAKSIVAAAKKMI